MVDMMNGIAIWTIALFGLMMIGLLIWLIVNSVTALHSSNSGDEMNDAREIGEQEFEEKQQLLEQ
jgi:hypothetical protein